MYTTLTKCALCVGVFLFLGQLDKGAYADSILIENESIVDSTQGGQPPAQVQFFSRFSLNGGMCPQGTTPLNGGECRQDSNNLVSVFTFRDYGITNIAEAGSLLQMRILLPTGNGFNGDPNFVNATGLVRLFARESLATSPIFVGERTIDSNGTMDLSLFGPLPSSVNSPNFYFYFSIVRCPTPRTNDPCFGFPSNSGLIARTGGHIAILSNAAPVPEPATMILLGTGLAAIAMRRRKRRAPTD